MSDTLQEMRVLLAAPNYFPSVGGVEMHVYEIGCRLACAGCDVTILTTTTNSRWLGTEESDGMHIRRVRTWPAKGYFYFAPDIYNVVAGGGWSIVHCHDVETLFGLQVMLASWITRIPYVVTFHSGYPLGPPSGAGAFSNCLRTAIRRLKWAALRPLFKRAKRLIGVSSFVAERFRKQLDLPEEHFVIISNGGNLPKVTTTLSRNPSEPLIVSSGRLERFKGHQRIIEALPLVCKHYPGVRLRIVGAGPYEAELRKLMRVLGVEDRVQIEAIPAKDRFRMAHVLADASLVTHLSEYEAQPLAALEALSLGRPLLVTDIPAFHGLAEQGLVRTIPCESTVEEVAAAVLHQLRDPLVPSNITIPTWEDGVKNLLSLYCSLEG